MFSKIRLTGVMPAVWTLSVLMCLAIDVFYFPAWPTFLDEQRFLASAAHWLSDGEFLSKGGRAWEMPLPSMFFAALRWLFGGDETRGLYAIRFAQSLLIVLQSWLVLRITRSVCGDGWAAGLAGTIAAFYPFFLFYQGLALSETVFDTALLAFFGMLYAWRDRGCAIGAVLVGVVIMGAVATYARASLTILPPLLPAVVAWSKRCTTRHSLSVLAVAVAVYAGMLAPWWVRNYFLFDAFVPFTTSSASNLYLGNNAANWGGGNDWGKDVEFDVVERINAIPGEMDRQAAYAQAAKDFIRRQPGRAFGLALKKIRRFWSVIPNADGYNSGMLAVVSAVSFGPVLLLSLLGLFVNRHLWRELAPIYLLIVYVTALHTLTIASLRYRLPLEPFMIILAAMTVGRCLPRRRTA